MSRSVDPTWIGLIAVALGSAALFAPALSRWAHPARTPGATGLADIAVDGDGDGGGRCRGPERHRSLRRIGARHAATASNDRFVRMHRRARGPVPPDVVAVWLDDVARSTRVGATIGGAVLDAPATGPLAASVHALRMRLRHGDSFADAVDRWREQLGSDEDSLSTAATVLLVADEVGGSLALPLERAAALLRGRAADALERSGWAAQARLSARVMAILPVAVLALLVTIDDNVLIAATSGVGLLLVGLGAVLDAAGFAWMRHIVQRAER